MRLAQEFEHFEAVDSGQHHIKDDEVVGRLLPFAQRRLAIVHDDDIVPRRGQRARNMAREPHLIFYDQDAHAIYGNLSTGGKNAERTFHWEIPLGDARKVTSLLLFIPYLFARRLPSFFGR